MSFEKPSTPEHSPETLKLSRALRAFADEYRAEGLPVTDFCRVDVHGFQEVYGEDEVQRDKSVLEAQERQIGGPEEDELALLDKAGGERLEALTAVVLNKFLAEDFIVLRSSRYDDVVHKVDTLILDRASGELVCAVDEVQDIRGQQFLRKRDEIIKRNKNRGAKVRYGFSRSGDLIRPGERKDVPIFYFALPAEYLREGVRQMSEDPKEISEYERKIFDAFVSLLEVESKMLNLSFSDLVPPLQTALKRFQISLERMKEVL